jgi:uncharacterized membrane protein
MQLKQLMAAGTVVLFVSCSNKSVPTPTIYFPQVKAIIQTNCVTCHHPGGQGMPTFLETDDEIVTLAAAIKRAVIDPISPTNKRMPLGGTLSDADKNTIAQWYAKGGKASD